MLHSAGAWQNCLEVYQEARTSQRDVGQQGFEWVLLACAEAGQVNLANRPSDWLWVPGLPID